MNLPTVLQEVIFARKPFLANLRAVGVGTVEFLKLPGVGTLKVTVELRPSVESGPAVDRAAGDLQGVSCALVDSTGYGRNIIQYKVDINSKVGMLTQRHQHNYHHNGFQRAHQHRGQLHRLE